AFALGVSAVYTVLFLPTVPVAPFLILLFGLGLLLLAPLLSLVAALVGRRYLVRTAGHAPVSFWAGLALALGVMLALDAPAALTRIGMQMASAHEAEDQLRGVRFLRAVGNEDILLRYCHPRSQHKGGIFGALVDLRATFTPQQARTIFFRVTGESYDSRPVPPTRGRFDRDNPFDIDVGGEKVGQHIGAIELSSSRIDGSLDVLSALGYLEWTMTLRNNADNQQEGRAELLLPAGAVVSRATLWIDGEEHEAAFGGRGQVRAAYQSVVRARRDPLLVTTAGSGRVLVQMFPIPPHGEMKIRIGITTPLQLTDLQRASMQLPLISERNFEIPAALRHAVWIESAAPLTGNALLRAEQVKPALYVLRGDVADLTPGADLPLVEARRAQPNLVAWSRDDKGSSKDMIVQTISEQPATPPRRIAVVIDGSASLSRFRHKLQDAIAALPPAAAVRLIFAGDGAPTWRDHRSADSGASHDFIKALDFAGGRDNAAALSQAWEWASGDDNAAIVWIHGPQPENGATADTLLQTIARRPAQTALYDLQVVQGANDIGARIAGPGFAETVYNSARGAAELRPLFESWRLDARHYVVKRERAPLRPMSNEALTSGHLARLWAAQQIAQIAADPARHDEAVTMASTYQLVTPVSGAVVLESQAAYDNAGLQPVAPGSVPTIPEPETWAMLAVALLILGVHGYRRRRA
ncbi:MAG TPA: VIT domain-containing protein, partial [Telluria sp.]|nr:VIT domain-containing protein [Telluria sp.]